MNQDETRFTATNEWCRMENGALLIGVTAQGLAALGDLIFADLPEAGDEVLREVPFGELEGVNDVKDLNSPVDGVVEEVNTRITQNPDVLTKSPMKEWLIRLKPDAPPTLENLLSQADYDELNRKKRAK